MTKQDLIKKLARTKKANQELSLSTVHQRNRALLEIAKILEQNQAEILRVNQRDIEKIERTNPLCDRLLLTKERLKNIINDIKTMTKLPDPVNQILEQRTLKNRLKLKKISVPFGVIAVIYESRPNVTVDVVGLCLKSGNAIVLKGGVDAWATNQILVRLIKQAIKKAGFSQDLILNINPKDRYLVRHLLSAKDYIDLIIPRGGTGLIKFVQENTKIPMIETGAGVCHTYVDDSANLEMAVNIIYNGKTSRPSACNALDTLIVCHKIADRFLPILGQKLAESQVEIFADSISHKILRQSKYPYLQRVQKTDFGREFLSLKMAIKTVEDIDEALAHVRKYSTKHSEAIVTETSQNAQRFLSEVDAACVYHNASTRFTDGSEFGMGGEIGISTQKMHARGPMSASELATYKWVIKGIGQVR
ncbi:MAG: glutamate-5-semialdehyde dehydrogenase [Patescibacteria group bacterium]